MSERGSFLELAAADPSREREASALGSHSPPSIQPSAAWAASPSSRSRQRVTPGAGRRQVGCPSLTMPEPMPAPGARARCTARAEAPYRFTPASCSSARIACLRPRRTDYAGLSSSSHSPSEPRTTPPPAIRSATIAPLALRLWLSACLSSLSPCSPSSSSPVPVVAAPRSASRPQRGYPLSAASWPAFSATAAKASPPRPEDHTSLSAAAGSLHAS